MAESRPGVSSCSSPSDFLAWVGAKTKLDRDAMGVDTLNHFSFPCWVFQVWSQRKDSWGSGEWVGVSQHRSPETL